MRLSQAAFTATVVYASAIAYERLAGCLPVWGTGVPSFSIYVATLAVALAGASIPSHPYAYLASRLLPAAIYEGVAPSGVLSGECVACRPWLMWDACPAGCQLAAAAQRGAILHGAQMRWPLADVSQLVALCTCSAGTLLPGNFDTVNLERFGAAGVLPARVPNCSAGGFGTCP